MIFDYFIERALWAVLIVSGVPLVTASLSGLMVAVLQAATQIQEQSILYLVKVSSVIITFVILGGWFWNEVLLLFQDVLQGMMQLGEIT